MKAIDMVFNLLASPARVRVMPACATTEAERNAQRIKAYQARVAASDEFDATPGRLAHRAAGGIHAMRFWQTHWRRMAEKKVMAAQSTARHPLMLVPRETRRAGAQ